MKNILFLLLAISTFAFTGCSDDKDKLNTDIMLNVGETYTFPSPVGIELSSNAFVAEITKTGIKAVHAGETTATVKQDGSLYELKIKVVANNTFYDNEELMSYMGKEKAAMIAIFGEPVNTVENLYTFAPLPQFNGSKAISVQFLEGVVHAVKIDYPANNVALLTKHIEDRYNKVKPQTEVPYLVFIDGLDAKDWTIEIFLQNANGTASALYMTRKFTEDTITNPKN